MSTTAAPASADATASAEHFGSAPFGTEHPNLEFLKSSLPRWYFEASTSLRQALRQSQLKSQRSRHIVEPIRARLIPLKDFAKPLLEQALLDRFGMHLDVLVNQLVTMRIKTEMPFVISERQAMQQSLLDAALQNFEASATDPGGFEEGAALLQASSGLRMEQGQGFMSLGLYRYRDVIDIPPEQFAQLCRALDLGGRYQRHLDSIFKPASADGQPAELTAAAVAQAFMDSERDAVEVLAHIARMKGHLSQTGHEMLLEVVKPDGAVQWNGKPVRYRQLHMLDTYAFAGSCLFGALLIEPDEAGEDLPCVVYMPGEPDTPIKEYACFTDFSDGLRGKLFDTDYQAYFRRFVSARQSARFFRKIEERLKPLRPLGGDSSSSVQVRTSDANAQLYLEKRPMDKPPFELLHEHLVTKTYDDSRFVAVPTSDEDQLSRLKRWDELESLGLDLLNVAGFFVPVLGVVMAVVAAGQLLHEAFVAVEDWTHGETEEAIDHLFNIGESLATMAVVGAAVHVAPRVLPSEFIESLRPVNLANGLKRLWKPELTPFAHEVKLPVTALPEADGLIRQGAQTWLPRDGKLYRVEQDANSGTWRIKHPTDTGSHSPSLEHNGSGAWRHEGENPMGWDDVTAFRRLDAGHYVFTEPSVQRILGITGADEALLRQVHMENLSTPALLKDTSLRFRIARQVDEFIHLMHSNELQRLSPPRIEPYLKLLTSMPGWPADRALHLMDADGKILRSWNTSTRAMSFTSVSYRADNVAGLLESVMGSMTANELDALLGDAPVVQGQTYLQRLTRAIAEHAGTVKGQLLDDCYALETRSDDPLVKLIKRDWPGLPDGVASELVSIANSQELARMRSAGRIPLRLAEQAREYVQQLRLNRACEGFFLDTAANSDTAKLTFGLLGHLPGIPADFVLELRDEAWQMLAILGESQSPAEHHVLIRSETGYQAFNLQGQPLANRPKPFFAAALDAMPERIRSAIGLHDEAGERQLRALLGEYAIGQREALAGMLDLQAIKPGFQSLQRLADGRVGYPMSGRLRGMFRKLGVGAESYSPELAVKKLYPGFLDAEIHVFLDGLRAEHTGPAYAFNAFVKTRLTALAAEYKDLETSLDAWILAQETVTIPGRYFPQITRDAKATAAIRIKLCWRRLGERRYQDDGSFMGYELDLNDLACGALPRLSADFSHVGALTANRIDMTPAQINQLLRQFKKLCHLSLDGNEIDVLPQVFGSLTRLQRLSLRDNPLVLDTDSVGLLRDMGSLKTLHLDHCPVGPLLDVSPLGRLVALGLRATGIDTLPGGLWECPFLREVDLRENHINDLSYIVMENLSRAYFRVQLHDNPLNDHSLIRAEGFFNAAARQRMGIANVRVHAESSSGIRSPWMHGVDSIDLSARLLEWSDLEAEPGSTDFFRVLRDLTGSSDFQSDRDVLGQRVWALLDAIAENKVLREEVYSLAAHPQTCGDGVAIVFSDLELHVLIFKILSSRNIATHPVHMFKLVRGIARLDEVEKIALENIRTREYLGETVDHVEVRMAYRIGLAARLQLPEQIHSMLYLASANVTRQMLDSAATRILAQESSESFMKSLLGRDFWMTFLEKRFASSFEKVQEPFHQQLDALFSAGRGELTDAQYLQSIQPIQQQRHAAVEANAQKLTWQIAREVYIQENVGAMSAG
ncbi:MAG TPA: NEL-type E3 ubiquitin ligase domain-containing protein [Pseudomonas sp.]|jgi:hypothetical protein